MDHGLGVLVIGSLQLRLSNWRIGFRRLHYVQDEVLVG